MSELDTMLAMLDRAKIAYEHLGERSGGTILNIKGEYGLGTAFYFEPGGTLESVEAYDGPYDDADASAKAAPTANA